VSDEWNPNDPDATRVLYDLSGWTFDQQADLAAELAESEIPHTWDGAELVVPESHEALADSAIARVELRLGISYEGDEVVVQEVAAVDGPAPLEIPDGEATTEYDVVEWSEGDRQSITRALTRQTVPYRWEDDLLVVPTTSEAIVESLMDMIEQGTFAAHADDLPGEFDDDVEDDGERLPFETLTTFFLAGVRLQKNPMDADGLEQLVAAIEVADPTKPPYGVDLRLWQRTCELADELAGALADNDEPDHDETVAVAGELHDLLRPFI
jgi:hypothetical protein